MIQRIQSVLLALLIIFYVVLFFIPLANIGSVATHEYSTRGIKVLASGEITRLPMSHWLQIDALLVIGLSAVTIALFKKRLLQIRLTKVNMLLNLIFIVILLFGAESDCKVFLQIEEVTLNYSFGTFVPLLGMILLFLAGRYIKKDEELVRAADRLR